MLILQTTNSAPAGAVPCSVFMGGPMIRLCLTGELGVPSLLKATLHYFIISIV